MSTYYQIAHYPFELCLQNGPNATDPSWMVQLDSILRAFRLEGRPTLSTPITHPEIEVETMHGILHCAVEAGFPRLTIQPDASAAEADMIDLIDAFEPEIVNQAVRESLNILWIHGACLVRDGELTLLVATSGTGKTTLSLGLLHYGYQLITDDIILMTLGTTPQMLPVPRCPKFRSPADDYLRAIGFDLEKEAELIQRYVLLPEARFHVARILPRIRRVFLLSRDPQHTPGVTPLDITSGILALLPHSNLIGIDPALEFAHQLFHETQFLQMNLSHYPDDLRLIAG